MAEALTTGLLGCRYVQLDQRLRDAGSKVVSGLSSNLRLGVLHCITPCLEGASTSFHTYLIGRMSSEILRGLRDANTRQIISLVSSHSHRRPPPFDSPEFISTTCSHIAILAREKLSTDS